MLAAKLRAPGLEHVAGLGREPHQDLTGTAPFTQLGEHIRRRLQDDVRHPLVLLQLRVRDDLRPEVRDGGGHHHGVGRLRVLEDGVAQLLRRLDPHDVDAGRRRDRSGAEDEGHRRAPSRRFGGERDAHPAARAIADEPNRIDRLVRRAGRDQDASAVEVARTERAEHGLHDVVRLAHAADACVAVREGTVRRSDETDAARLERRDVGPRRLGVPHAGVHRGREHDGAVVFEQGRGQQVVGRAVRELRQDVRRARRDDDEVGVVREPDVQDLTRALPQGGERLPAGQRGERRGADEPGRRLGQDTGDLGLSGDERAREDRGLVGGDAPGDRRAARAARPRGYPMTMGSSGRS